MVCLRLALCFLFMVMTLKSYAARPTEDVVFLKDGSIIRGQIIEQVPGEFVRIQTIGGSMFVLKVSEIKAIKKEPQMLVAKSKSPVLATGMSILIPGLGQFYNEEYEEGVGHFIFFAIGILFFRAGVEDDVYLGKLGRLDADDDDWKTRIGLSLWAGAIVDSAHDAYTSAKKFNERNQLLTHLRFTPMMPINNGVGAMLSYSF